MTTLRRVITGHNERGKSVVVADKAAIEFGPLSEMWFTDRSPCGYGSEDEVADRPVRLEPPRSRDVTALLSGRAGRPRAEPR